MPPKISLSGGHPFYPSLFFLRLNTAEAIEARTRGVSRNVVGVRGRSSGDSSPQTPTASPSPPSTLPQEIVERVVANLIGNMHDLLACSLTCHSWYLATFPHRHHTLSPQRIAGARTGYLCGPNRSCAWANLVSSLSSGSSNPQGQRSSPPRNFSETVRPSHPTPLLRVVQCPGTRDRTPGYSQLHAKDPTVL